MKKSVLVGIALLVFPFIVNAADIGSLKSAYNTYTQAVMRGDVDKVLSLVGDSFVHASPTSPVPIAKNKEEKRIELKVFYTGMKGLQIMSHSPTFYIVNDTGIVFGHRMIRGEWDNRRVGYDDRFVMSFSKRDGKWVLVAEVSDPVKLGVNKANY